MEYTNKKFVTLGIVVLVLGVILGGAVVGGWYHYRGTAGAKSANVSQVNQAQVQALLSQVGKLVILPVGEDPVVATINDADALIKQQAFYKGAQNGDVVLVYQKAAKAIVYSPSRNIIVNIGPVVLQDQTAAASSSTNTAATSSKK